MNDKKVIVIEDYREAWIIADCLCVACCHKWSAVAHEEKQNKLECPECGEMMGAVIATIP